MNLYNPIKLVTIAIVKYAQSAIRNSFEDEQSKAARNRDGLPPAKLPSSPCEGSFSIPVNVFITLSTVADSILKGCDREVPTRTTSGRKEYHCWKDSLYSAAQSTTLFAN